MTHHNTDLAPRIERRCLLGLGLAGAASALCACGRGQAATGISPETLEDDEQMAFATQTSDLSRLSARPQPNPTGTLAPGLQPLGLGSGRDGLLYVPKGYRADRPAPLAVLLHGAGGNAQHGIGLLRDLADSAGLLLLAPDARRSTWDIIASEAYGPDVAYLDRALQQLFRSASVDPARLAIGGFSDGASYALSLGVSNGDLFTHIIAFSPGFMAPPEQRGRPRVYISHGKSDGVLPIDRCSRRLAPRLQRAGYDLRYHEFDGPHTVPPEIAREALGWFLPAAP